MNSVFESLMQVRRGEGRGGEGLWGGEGRGCGEGRGGVVGKEGVRWVLIHILLNLSLCQILSVPEMRDHHGYDGVVVVTMLINYRKYEVSIV